MSHVPADALAGQVLGDSDALTTGELQHLASCPRCSAELAELSRLHVKVSAGAGRPDEPLVQPGRPLLARIKAELGADFAPRRPASPAVAAVREVGPTARTPARAERRPGRRRGVALIAAAVGLVAGAGGVVAVQQLRSGETQVLASIRLSALPGHQGQGTAELVREGSAERLQVQTDISGSAQDYREIWLINTDGQRMYSLGVLTQTGTGSYPVPPALAGNLQSYTIVDISIEPYDGNAAHSHNSQLRGNLPG